MNECELMEGVKI